MSTIIENYLSLQTALINEKARIQALLSEIVKVLGTNGAVAAPAPFVKGGRRTFSEATKAKMRAAQQARWAKKGSKAGQATATTPKKRFFPAHNG